ncbi:MAG: GTP 3',8-cyclase MoaA [Holophagaceae bacterium]|nr:GTP 3',8-cyclase MoaA [Holophagaceae bacterium]
MLQDKFGRTIDYLRISVTDRCDLRCIFCMPPEGVPRLDHANILRFEEIIAIVRVAEELGIKKIRLTGGEPLTRTGIVSLVKNLSGISGIDNLAMTTNGVLFHNMGHSLQTAGLHRINFGISSLDEATYNKITRGGNLSKALEGLDTAIKLGFAPIKINVVVQKGINEDLTKFIALAIEKPVHVRFIEYMPIGAETHSALFVPATEIFHSIEATTKLVPIEKSKSNSQAPNAWQIKDGCGSISIIAPISENHCGNCNRLRLTADGQLRPCLFSKEEVDIKPALRPTINAEQIKSLIINAIASKPKSLRETSDFGRRMSQIGG